MPEPADLSVIARLVEQYAGLLYRYAYRLTGSVHDAEDLVQQTFAAAHEKLSTIRDLERIQGWLLTALRRNYYKSIRKRTELTASSLDVDEGEWPDDASVETEVDSERLQLALNRLPEPYRLVVLMFYFEDYSYPEIARELELPIGTVMSRLARAKSQLRRLLPMGGGEQKPNSERGNGDTRGVPVVVEAVKLIKK